MLSCSVLSDSLWCCGLQSARCLSLWDSPNKSTGVGCHFLLQGTFLNQGSNPYLLCFLHWQADSLLLSHLGSLINTLAILKLSGNWVSENLIKFTPLLNACIRFWTHALLIPEPKLVWLYCTCKQISKIKNKKVHVTQYVKNITIY